MAEPAQPLDINTLHNVHIVGDLIQVIVELNVETIAKSHWTDGPTYDFYLKYS